MLEAEISFQLMLTKLPQVLPADEASVSSIRRAPPEWKCE